MEHVVKRGEYLSKIAANYGITLNRLLAANPRYKADPNSLGIGDRLLIPEQQGEPAVQEPLRPEPTVGDAATEQPGETDADYFLVPEGQLTFDAEGMEKRGKFFSRSPHVPGRWSGVTIGRGYDMGSRSEDEITEDLGNAGVPLAEARRLATCRGLKGAGAKQFLEEHDLYGIEITPAAQKALFMQTYQELAGDVLRICSKHDVVAKYGATDWDGLDPLIRDIAVDLRYRGDYTGATRERVQPLLVANDLEALKTLMADENYWVGSRGVPKDRFRRRRKYVSG